MPTYTYILLSNMNRLKQERLDVSHVQDDSHMVLKSQQTVRYPAAHLFYILWHPAP